MASITYSSITDGSVQGFPEWYFVTASLVDNQFAISADDLGFTLSNNAHVEVYPTADGDSTKAELWFLKSDVTGDTVNVSIPSRYFVLATQIPDGVSANVSFDDTPPVDDGTPPVDDGTPPVDDGTTPPVIEPEANQGTIEYSITSLNEDVANDGSVTEIVTLTLTGDTFYSELAGVDLNDSQSDFYFGDVVMGVPEGLTAHLIVSDDLTTAELTFDGYADYNEASDSATPDYAPFPPVQVSLLSTYFESNIAAVSADQDLSIMFQDASAMFTDGSFVESMKDNGSVTGKVTITLQNSEFAANLIGTDLNADGSYVESTSIPAGLTAQLMIIDATTAELTLTGTADSNDVADSIQNLSYGFQAADFKSGELPLDADFQTANVTFIEPSLVWDKASINDGEQDGFVDQTATITLMDGARFVRSDLDLSNFVTGYQYLGSDVTVTLIATSETEATLTINGVTDSFDPTTLTLNLPKLAFVGRMDVAGRDSGIEITFDDSTAPDAPAFVDVSDSEITDSERADGVVTITGTGEPYATIKLTLASSTTVSTSSSLEIPDLMVIAQNAANDFAIKDAAATAAEDRAAELLDAETAADDADTNALDALDAILTEAIDAFDALDATATDLEDNLGDAPTAADIAAADAARAAADEADAAVTVADENSGNFTFPAYEAATAATALADEEASALRQMADAADITLQDALDALEAAGGDSSLIVAGETPVDETPVDETPVDDTPVDETPVDETPVDETPVDDTPVDTTGETINPDNVISTTTVTVDEFGDWSYDLQDSDYPANHETLLIGAVAVDASGNESAGSVVAIALTDDMAPEMPVIDAVATDNDITKAEKDAGVIITGTAEANAEVVVMIGDVTVESVIADEIGRWEYALTDEDYAAVDIDTGVLALSVAAIDEAGNESDAADIELTVADFTPPDAPEFTSDEVTPLVYGAKLSGIAETGSVSVELRIGDEFNGITRTVPVNATTGVWEYTLKNVAVAALADSDVQIITAIAIDTAGNRSEPTDFIPTPDEFADAPTVSLNDTGADDADAITNDATLVVTDTELGATVEFSSTGTDGWSVNQPTATQGVNTVFVRQTDIALNVSDNAEITFTFDNVILPITIETPAVTTTAALAISGVEQDAVVEYSADGTDGTWLEAELTYAEGLNTGFVRQTDLAGNMSVATAYSFTVDTIVPVMPVLSLVTDDGVLATDGISTDGTVVVASIEEGATWTYSINGAAAITGDTTNSFVLPIGDYAAGNVKVVQTDAAGNASVVGENAVLKIIASGPTAVAVTVAGTTDAGTGAFAFNVANNGEVYNIANFGTDDSIDFPAGLTPTLINDNFGDGSVDLQYAADGKVTMLHLTGLSTSDDGAVFGLTSFKTLFGANSVTNTGTGAVANNTTPATPTTPVSTTIDSTIEVAAAGNSDAATGNVQFNLAAGNYAYSVAGFTTGDVLNFPDTATATIINDNFTDNSVGVQWASNGTVVLVTLTGIANDASIFGATSFKAAFGDGAII